MNQILEAIALGIVLAGVIPATLYPIVYSRSPWRRSFIGRALMTKAIGMALLVDFAALYIVIPGSAPAALRVFVYALVIGGIWLQFIALLRARRRRD